MSDHVLPADAPGAATILELAQDHFRDRLLPLLPSEARADAELLLRALKVARADFTPHPEVELLGSLRALGFADSDSLTRAIRSGACDGDGTIEAWLRSYVREKLRAAGDEPDQGDATGGVANPL